MIRLMLLLAAGAEGDAEPAGYSVTPLQADVSFNFAIADRSQLAGTFFVGGALGSIVEGRTGYFAALGPELTYTVKGDPYRISLGAELRLGLAWGQRRGFTSTIFPDLLVFFRLTPFGAGLVTESKNMAGMPVTTSASFFGVRAGFGLTSIWPARTYFDNFPFFDVDGFWGEVLKVATTIFLFPLVVVNHAEVGFEYVRSPAPLYAVVFRIGAGF